VSNRLLQSESPEYDEAMTVSSWRNTSQDCEQSLLREDIYDPITDVTISVWSGAGSAAVC
jgi:hypothetical protein